jgi:hypothetical protein
MLLRRALARRIGVVTIEAGFAAKLWACAASAAIAGYLIKQIFGFGAPRVLGFLVVGVFAGIYFCGTWLLGVPEAKQLLGTLRKRLRI